MPPLVRRFSCIMLLPKENAEVFLIEVRQRMLSLLD